MPKLPALERLDLILNGVNKYQNPDIDFRFLYNKITGNNNNSAQVDGINGVSSALEKLIRDGFVRSEIRDMVSIDDVGNKSSAKMSWYSTTFEGEAFIETGGYVRRNKIEAANARTVKVLNWAVAIGGGVAAIYYFLEILKSYIMPLFQSCSTSYFRGY